MFRQSPSSRSASSSASTNQPVSVGLWLSMLSLLAVGVNAVKSAPTLTLFSSTTSSDVYRIVSDPKFNAGCRSIPAVVTEIVKACGVTVGVNTLPEIWSQVASYLGGDVLFEQGAGQNAQSEAAQCIEGFLDAFARGFPTHEQFPVWLIVMIAVVACAVLLGAAVCAAGVTALVCYGVNRQRQRSDEERPLLPDGQIPFTNPSAGR